MPRPPVCAVSARRPGVTALRLIHRAVCVQCVVLLHLQTAGGIFLPDTQAKKNEGVVSVPAGRRRSSRAAPLLPPPRVASPVTVAV